MIQVTKQNLIIGTEWVKLEDAIKEQSPAFAFESGKVYRISNSSNTLWETETAGVPTELEGVAIKGGESFEYDLDEGYSLYVRSADQLCGICVESGDKSESATSAVNATTAAVNAQGANIVSAIDNLTAAIESGTAAVENALKTVNSGD